MRRAGLQKFNFHGRYFSTGRGGAMDQVRNKTFITPGCCGNAMAAVACLRGNVRVMSGVGSTFPERRSAIPLAKGPQREPTIVISLTTMGHLSTRTAS